MMQRLFLHKTKYTNQIIIILNHSRFCNSDFVSNLSKKTLQPNNCILDGKCVFHSRFIAAPVFSGCGLLPSLTSSLCKCSWPKILNHRNSTNHLIRDHKVWTNFQQNFQKSIILNLQLQLIVVQFLLQFSGSHISKTFSKVSNSSVFVSPLVEDFWKCQN